MDQDFPLIRKMRAGDEEAIDAFVRKYYPDIFRYCCRHLGNLSDAEDLTQETFARFFHSFQEYRHYGKAKNYLYVIAGNLCKNHYKEKTAQSLDTVPESVEDPGPGLDRRLDLESALEKLPMELRNVLILHYFQDLKLREIADILQIGLPLVKYRMARAKEQLQKLLGEEEPS